MQKTGGADPDSLGNPHRPTGSRHFNFFLYCNRRARTGKPPESEELYRRRGLRE